MDVERRRNREKANVLLELCAVLKFLAADNGNFTIRSFERMPCHGTKELAGAMNPINYVPPEVWANQGKAYHLHEDQAHGNGQGSMNPQRGSNGQGSMNAQRTSNVQGPPPNSQGPLIVQQRPRSLLPPPPPVMHGRAAVTRLSKTVSSLGLSPIYHKEFYDTFESRRKPVTLVGIRKKSILPSSMSMYNARPVMKSAEVAVMQSPYNDISSAF